MKILLILLFASVAMAQPTQHVVCSIGGSSTNNCTISATASGGTVTVHAIGFGYGAITGVTGGGTYASLSVGSSDSSSTVKTDSWCATGITAGTTSISITTTTAFTGGEIIIAEWPSLTCTVDTSQIDNNQTTSTTPQGGMLTTSNASDTIISLEGGQRAITGFSTANSFTLTDDNNSTPAVEYGAASYRKVTSTGTYTAPAWTQSGGGTYSTSTFGLKASGGASSGGTKSGGSSKRGGTSKQ